MSATFGSFTCPANGSYSLACDNPHDVFRYTEAGAAWTLICAMILILMKAGFLMIELSFASEVPERRNIVLIKYLDVAGTAIAFWWFGFNLSHIYANSNEYFSNSVIDIVNISCRNSIPYITWFFKFGFASNTATLMGGLLVKCPYKLRIFSAFASAFVVGGFIHTVVARFVWGGGKSDFLSPYRFCLNSSQDPDPDFSTYSTIDKLYVLDFAGGGAVHVVGGISALALTTIVSIQLWVDSYKKDKNEEVGANNIEKRSKWDIVRFLHHMYPKSGGDDKIEDAALGVFILLFCWFAFNCGTTESLEGPNRDYPVYSNVAGRIAVNMVISASGGGIMATIIASIVQIVTKGNAINCNEIANGILTSLVAITSNCPYVDNSSALAIGIIAVLFYHLGVYLEYKLSLFDTGRVVPVHAFGGMWSLLAGAIFVTHRVPYDYLRETYEGVCYCKLRLPFLFFFERLAAQLLGILFMVVFSFVVAFLFYLTLFLIRIDLILNRLGENGEKIKNAFSLGTGGILLINQMEGKAEEVISTTLVYNPADIEIKESFKKSEKKLSQIVKDDTNVMVDDDIKHL